MEDKDYSYYDLIDHIYWISGHFDWEGHFDWWYVGKYALNLVLLIGLLVYLLRKPFGEFLRNRKERLRSEVARAEEASEKARAAFEEYSAKLDAVSSEIGSLTENIRKQGETERAELVSQARKSGEAIRKEVEDTIRLETARAVSEIQAEVVESAVALAEKMIKEKVDRNFTSGSVGDFVKTVEEGRWQRSLH